MRRTRSINNTAAISAKRIAQRTCVACRQIKDKRELIRLVRNPDGQVEIDSRGKKAGRGAYLCPARECWETGLKGNRLEYALRGSLTRDNREQLSKWAKNLPKELSSGKG